LRDGPSARFRALQGRLRNAWPPVSASTRVAARWAKRFVLNRTVRNSPAVAADFPVFIFLLTFGLLTGRGIWQTCGPTASLRWWTGSTAPSVIRVRGAMFFRRLPRRWGPGELFSSSHPRQLLKPRASGRRR